MPRPPLPDPSHIETRLLVVAEMLEKAVGEVRRAMSEVRGDPPPPPFPANGGNPITADPTTDDTPRSTDGDC